MTYKLIYIFLFFYFSSFCWSQETSTLPETPDELKTDELLNIELPPLDVLFESSRQSPAVEIYKLRLQQEASTLKTERRSWLKYFSLSSTFQYGSVGINNYMSTVDIASIYTSSGSKQSWYNVGGSWHRYRPLRRPSRSPAPTRRSGRRHARRRCRHR